MSRLVTAPDRVGFHDLVAMMESVTCCGGITVTMDDMMHAISLDL